MLKKGLLSIIALGIGSMLFVGCGKEELSTEDISFTVKQHYDEERDLDNSYDLNFDFPEEFDEIKVVLYVEKLDNVKEEEKKFATLNVDGKDEEGGISVLNQIKGEYKYRLVAEDKEGNIAEKDLTVKVTKDGEEVKESDNGDSEVESKDDEAKEYKPWDGNGVEYKKDDEVEFEGRTYSCIQDHKSQADWTPKSAVSLWQEF